MPLEPMNEVTFVGRLGSFTSVRAERRRTAGLPVLIALGDVEERQQDPVTRRIKRCDIRLSSASGRKLASGEMKRPEVPEGRDPRNESLRQDARAKAVGRGLPYYFTCNMAEVVLYEVAPRPGEEDKEVKSYTLAPVRHSREVEANIAQIEEGWATFLDELEEKLQAVASARPSVTSEDVLALKNAIYAIADEALLRVERALRDDPSLADDVREEALRTFGLPVALNPRFPAQQRAEVLQAIRLGIFVVAQKLVLYRVLAEVGPRRATTFTLDTLNLPETSTDPLVVRALLDRAVAQAITRSRDYETAFLPTPLVDVVFTAPLGPDEVAECRVGEVWAELARAVESASWTAIERNLVGFLYEVIVEPDFRRELGQFYTREDVVDVLTSFAVRTPADVVLDPSAGGGSFVRSAYQRKRELGAQHEQALAGVWAFEIAAFAAELTTITLATADPHEPAAYPRVLLRDFFDVKPGVTTDLQLPGDPEPLKVPATFDAVIGNPPYISYRHQTSQSKVISALSKAPKTVHFPRFSGKSDEFVWFLAHATTFLGEGGRLAFVVSSALLFSDYGIPLIRFLGSHYRIVAVVDSMVERWFVDADTNTVLLMLERTNDAQARRENNIRFIRLRRPFAQLLPAPHETTRRQALEDLVDELTGLPAGEADPRFVAKLVPQGDQGGLEFVPRAAEDGVELGEESEGEGND